MKYIKFLFIFLIVLFLTLVTQVGGLILLLSFSTYKFLDRKTQNKFLRYSFKSLSFLLLYLGFSLAIVPILSKPLGRVPLPIVSTNNLQPANVLTCLLNRHYVRPELRETTFRVALRLSEKYPGTKINYLDASFPFIDGFRLFPHYSHNDGRKLDVSFQYDDVESKSITNRVPSFIGYGVCEEPIKGEKSMPEYCDRMGSWQYSILKKFASQKTKDKFMFKAERNRDMVNLFASSSNISRIYIEPHLKTRLGLTTSKIRFHGCKAVRHDDHLHVQL